MQNKQTSQAKPLTMSSISKDDFIDFLAHATPEELNERILEHGKPRKLYNPIYIFRDPNRKMEEKNEHNTEVDR